jgi:hypothetical protein
MISPFDLEGIVAAHFGERGGRTGIDPYGTPDLVGALAPEMVRAAGYSCAFTTDRRTFDGASERFLLGRFSDGDLLYNVPARRFAAG